MGGAIRLSDRFSRESAPPHPSRLLALKLSASRLNVVATRPAHIDLHA
jgi:hypothetical protein